MSPPNEHRRSIGFQVKPPSVPWGVSELGVAPDTHFDRGIGLSDLVAKGAAVIVFPPKPHDLLHMTDVTFPFQLLGNPGLRNDMHPYLMQQLTRRVGENRDSKPGQKGLAMDWIAANVMSTLTQCHEPSGEDPKIPPPYLEYFCPDKRNALGNTQNILQSSNAKGVLMHSETEKKITQFLGYDDESKFLAEMPTQIKGVFARAGMSKDDLDALMSRYREVYEFAHARHNAFNGPRKSGESYSCHLVRSLWYNLTFLEETKAVPTDLKSALCEIELMLHDIEEDVKQGDGGIKSAFYRVSDSNTFELVCPKDKNGSEVVTLKGISAESKRTLEALNAARVKTPGEEYYAAFAADSSGRAARFKSVGDRVDNTLTLHVSKTPLDHLYKLTETLFAFPPLCMSAVAPRNKKTDVQEIIATHLQTDADLARTFAPYLLAYGEYMRTLACIQQHVVGSNQELKLPSTANLPQIEHIMKRQAQRLGPLQKPEIMFFKDIPDHLSIKTLTEQYAATKVSNTNALPFGYAEVKTHVEQVYTRLYNTQFHASAPLCTELGGYSAFERFTPLAQYSMIGSQLRKDFWELVQMTLPCTGTLFERKAAIRHFFGMPEDTRPQIDLKDPPLLRAAEWAVRNVPKGSLTVRDFFGVQPNTLPQPKKDDPLLIQLAERIGSKVIAGALAYLPVDQTTPQSGTIFAPPAPKK